MTETVQISVNVILSCNVRQDGDLWVAGCPSLDVYSQGTSEDDAKRCLQEAIGLWIESCIERRTLRKALEECGFQKAQEAQEDSPALKEVIEISVKRLPKQDFGVSLTSLERTPDITIPAYQASMFVEAYAGLDAR